MKKRGFTLIELTIIFSVVAILSVIGLSISIDYNRTQLVNAAYEEFKSTLNTAKSRALSQNKPEDSGCTGTLIRYEVRISSLTQYLLRAVCSSGTALMKTVNLRNMTFDSAGFNISFFVLTGGSSGRTVILTGYGKSKAITVDTAGNIQ